jgi:integrase
LGLKLATELSAQRAGGQWGLSFPLVAGDLDEQGRRVDFHSLRLTFGTNLVLSGAHPRVVQELMRHSDIRLTMKLYTDISKLPVWEAVAALPSFAINVCRNGGNDSVLKVADI